MKEGSAILRPWLLVSILSFGALAGCASPPPSPEDFCHQEILQWTHYGLFHQMPKSGTIGNYSISTHYTDFGDAISRPQYEARWGKHRVGTIQWEPSGFVAPSDSWYPRLRITDPARISAIYEQSMTLEQAEYYFMTFARSVLAADEKTLRSYFSEFMKTDGRFTSGEDDQYVAGYPHEVTVANDFRLESFLDELHSKQKPMERGHHFGDLVLEWPDWEVGLSVRHKVAINASDDEVVRFITSAWGASEVRHGGLTPMETQEFTEVIRSVYRDLGFGNLPQALVDKHARMTSFTDCRSATESPS